MSSNAARPARPLSLLPLAVLAATIIVVALPGVATAAPGAGGVTLTVGGPGKAASGLADAGVKTAAIAPAKKRGKRIVLPVQSLVVGRSATVSLRGGIAFEVGNRSLRLRSLKLTLKARQATVSAKSGKRRLPVFAAGLPKGKAKLDASGTTAKLAGAKLGLTRKGAQLLRARLGADSIAAGTLGKLGIDARRAAAGGNGGAGGGNGGGAGGGGGPKAGPIQNEPPVLARPPGAVDVTAASLTWRPRESWIQYVAGGEGTSVTGGAANGPTEVKSGSDVPLVYSFDSFPLENGWYEPATGRAAIYFGGGVGFSHLDHGILFSASDPEIEINGGSSRAIFRFNGTHDTAFANQRGVLVNLHPSAIQTPPSGPVSYSAVPGTIPADTGASVFAGFYAANAPFGSIDVSFTTPTP